MGIDLPRYKCKQCGWEWTPRTAHPAVCPKCKRRDWNDEEVKSVDWDDEEVKDVTEVDNSQEPNKTNNK